MIIHLKHFSIPYRDRIKRFSIFNEQVELTMFNDDKRAFETTSSFMW